MRPDTTARIAALVAAVAWMGVIFALSSVPASALPPGRYGTLGHFALYAVLGALLLLAAPRTGRPWVAIVVAVTVASLYGITDEFHQLFVPGRVPDVADWAVDTAGALTASLLLETVRRVAAKRQ